MNLFSPRVYRSNINSVLNLYLFDPPIPNEGLGYSQLACLASIDTSYTR
jgi:hypothetical protein